MSTPQVIEKNGKPEYAVIPYGEYEKLIADSEMLEDLRDYDRITAAVEKGEEELVHHEIVVRLVDGESQIKVLRDYRSLTISELAQRVGITQPYLSQIEAGKREGKIGVLKNIAEALDLDLDHLVWG